MNKKYILHKECREAQWSKMSEKIGGPDQGEEVVLLTRSVLIFARGNLLNKCHLTFNVMLDVMLLARFLNTWPQGRRWIVIGCN